MLSPDHSVLLIPRVSVQSIADSTAFSRGSPTSASSSWANEWQEAKTCCVVIGTLCTGTNSFTLSLPTSKQQTHAENKQSTIKTEEYQRKSKDSLQQFSIAPQEQGSIFFAEHISLPCKQFQQTYQKPQQIKHRTSLSGKIITKQFYKFGHKAAKLRCVEPKWVAHPQVRTHGRKK